MKSTLLKLIMIIFVTRFLLMTTTPSYAQTPPVDPAYELVYAEEFNGAVIDSTFWFQRYPWHQRTNYKYLWCNTTTLIPQAAIKVWKSYSNHTLEQSNTPLSGGKLLLTTKKGDYWGEVWNWPGGIWERDSLLFHFTAGMIFSKFHIKYGYFEMRFKYPELPPTPKNYGGHGGGFWLWSGGDGTVTNYWSEIDFPETNAYCEDCDDQYNHAMVGCHYQKFANTTANHEAKVLGNFEPGVWYKTALNWTSNSIEYYINDVLVHSSLNNPEKMSPMFMIVNQGGCYQPLDNYCVPYDTINANGTQFPYINEIDYIRVYQPNTSSNNGYFLTSFNPATYINSVHVSIITGGTFNLENVTNQSFWASDYILMNEGTTIGNGNSVLFNVCLKDKVFSRVYPINDKSGGTVEEVPGSIIDKMNHNY